MNKEQQEFKDLCQSFAAVESKFKEIIKADDDYGSKNVGGADIPVDDKIRGCMQAMYAMIENVHQRISNLHGSMYAYQDEHQKGHLPPIVGAGAMNKALACLGMDGDYEAKKKSIFASKDLFTIKSTK